VPAGQRYARHYCGNYNLIYAHSPSDKRSPGRMSFDRRQLTSCGQDPSELKPKSEHEEYSCQHYSDGYELQHDYQVDLISGNACIIAINCYCKRVEKTPPDSCRKRIK
jgi:hypothetical protein